MSEMEEVDSPGKTGRPSGGRAGSPPDEIPNLTMRESEVLKWVSEGKRDSEIATVLGVSVRTINKHVQSILSKLKVETRTAAALHLVRHPVTPPSRSVDDRKREAP
jgi:DNA-binding NarL/FixJ family response regulator